MASTNCFSTTLSRCIDISSAYVHRKPDHLKKKHYTQLQKNTLSKKDKKFGRKCPRANDIRAQHKIGICYTGISPTYKFIHHAEH